MSSAEPKSAWEIAVEKLGAQDQADIVPLTGEQKKMIAEIRSRFRAKIAELDLRRQDGFRKAIARDAGEEGELLQQEFVREKERLGREEEALVKKVRENRE